VFSPKVTIFALMLMAGTLAGNAQSQKEIEMTAKAKAIIAQMTVEEKISQLMNATPGIDRLGIKPYDYWNEGLHGVGRTGRATVFPQPIGLGASFDTELVQTIGDAVSSEGRAKFFKAQSQNNYSRYAGLTFWSPNVNIFRDPRWGRGMETYGEDPFLTGRLGTAYVKGLQGTDPFYLKAGACAKHYAVHSGPERTRHEADIHPSQRDLYETYLPAFKELVEEGHVEVVMAAYNAVNGEACSGNHHLLTDILRNDWGFKGHIVSDCGAVDDIYGGHAMVPTPAEAAAIAIKAGLNLECGGSFVAIEEALEKHLLEEADLDKALVPLMMTRLKLGILENDKDCPYNNFSEDVICCDKHTALARRAAQESMVLLKNDRNVLPMKKDVETIFVTGPGATDVFTQMGNYYGLSPRYSTYLQGIVSKVSNGTSVNYRPGCMLVTPELNEMNWTPGEAAGADYTIVVMGINGNIEGEEGEAIASACRGDRESLAIPECQMQFLRNIKSNHPKNLIVILTGGSPLDLREVSELADAVVMAWYPGQEGGLALGDLLFGDANFSGRLPMTFPEDVNRLPDFEDYSMKGRTYKYMSDNIMYPFGYGLNYSHVDYADLQVEKYDKKAKNLRFTVTLRNTGNRAVDEVAQVYLSAPGAGETTAIEHLVAFERVHLDANSEVTREIVIPEADLQTVQEDGSLKLLKGNYTLTVGGAAPSARTTSLGVSQVQQSFKI